MKRHWIAVTVQVPVDAYAMSPGKAEEEGKKLLETVLRNTPFHISAWTYVRSQDISFRETI